MRNFCTILALNLVGHIAIAAGPADGIYSCNVVLAGATYSSYVTVNGHDDGASIYAIAAATPSTTLYGYGMGNATASRFAGTTMFGLPFSLSLNPSTGAMSGTVGIVWKGANVNAATACTKIW